MEGGVILRFPGDWVGPLEELVPFGPSADREDPSEAPDFWGEDSAALQMPEQPWIPQREPLRLRRWLLPAGAVVAAVLFVLAAVLGDSQSSPPQASAVPFTIASIPPLAAAPQAVKQGPVRHRTAPHVRRHPSSARPTRASTSTTATSSPPTTPAPTYHPAAASTSSASSSSQSGGAFTLGGP